VSVDRVRVSLNVFLFMPAVLVGTLLEGWLNPARPMLCCGIHRARATPAGTESTGTFSVNVPLASQLEAVDYCDPVSGAAVDTPGVFAVVYGDLGSTPMVGDCPVAMECRPVEIVSLPSLDLAIGEIVTAYADPGVLRDGRLAIVGADPLLPTMPDNTYRSFGRERGRAWSAGLARKAERET
jgi:flavin reductase (DIM6/NTAB) family NADH-FMN oxidoreductase RutF